MRLSSTRIDAAAHSISVLTFSFSAASILNSLYDTGEAVYGSRRYFYMVIEYIDAVRVEQNLDSLDIVERKEILTQLFGLLVQAHDKGIVNGDIDLKHLFWRREARKLVVIDWGNAKLGVDPNRTSEFSYDLARSAEIIFSLVTQIGHPSSTGSIALPDEARLVPGLKGLPKEFRRLCEWAPRTPSDAMPSPHTTLELLEASKKWPADSLSHPVDEVDGRSSWWPSFIVGILGISLIVAIGLLLPAISGLLSGTATTVPARVSPTSESVLTSSPVPMHTETPVSPVAGSATVEVSTEIPSPTPTLPPPANYDLRNPIRVYTDRPLEKEFRTCLANEISPPDLTALEGFYNQSYLDSKNDWWVFNVDGSRSVNDPIQTDFLPCLDRTPKAIVLNASVSRLLPSSAVEAIEFGLFLEGQNGHREYTLWVDSEGDTETMYLRIRDASQGTIDKQILLISSLDHSRIGGVEYDHFIVQMFLEVDNAGRDILYMLESPSEKVLFPDINPHNMIVFSSLPTIGNIQRIGLIGRGGPTTVIVWPIAFLAKAQP